MGVDLTSGKKTDHGEPSGPRATSAVSPWLFSRQSRPATRRKEDKCARNSRAQRRPVRVSSDIIAAVFPHSGGAETNGGGNSWATMLPSRSRSRRVERRKNRSWRTNAAARHVGSVALVVYPPELSAHTESFQSSERSAASGEASPICTEWRFFTRTGRRPSVAKKSGDRFCFAGVYPIGFGEDRHRRGHCAKGAFWQRRDCVLPRRFTRAGWRKATFANQLRGVDAFAESP